MLNFNKNILLAGAAFAAVAFTSCNGGVSSDNNLGNSVTSDGIKSFEVRENILSASQIYRMVLDGDTCYLTLSTNVQWPEELGGYDIRPLQDSIISYAFPEVKLPSDITSAIRTYIGDTALLDETGDYTKVDAVPTLSSRNYEMESNVRVLEITRGTVTYQVGAYSYIGGAHPNYYTEPFSYDLKGARVLTLANLFKSGSELELSKILASNLATQFGVTPDQLTEAGFFTNDLPVSHMVYLRNGTVMFHYNPYDIAPYSMGSIDIEVYPYQIQELLSPEVSTLFTR